jgi:hypothetical protein
MEKDHPFVGAKMREAVMDLTMDARRALPGLIGLLRGHRDAINRFNLTVGAFWRVFWLAMGIILAFDVGLAALTSRNGAQIAYDGTMIVLSIIGGSAAAVQVLLLMGALEEWEDRILRFLVPLGWIGVALWTAVTLWHLASAELGLSGSVDQSARTLLALVALYAAWQAARFGLRLSIGGACGVLIVYGCAQFAGFALVNLSVLLLPH